MRRLLLPILFAASVWSVSAKDPSVAVITEDLSGEVGDGGIEMVESLAESGISRAPGVSLISRRHLEKLLSEQGLAYNNIVNDRARLGRLVGADILLIVSIAKNRITQTRESVGSLERAHPCPTPIFQTPTVATAVPSTNAPRRWNPRSKA